ncbi:HAD family hydrolase [Marinobacterium sediminicola]|uniref:Phosphoglycolate phosphatase n=1 Tax=Marinobacterium sediminicola TaxID=518898 RepID=A0ABY1RZV0_9GAMM|nr:HAD-IA family hydrolase [Marinobacterium sediminicola]ULG70025.1 HAD-IA family hydrolase [Marinobacterium sediminicola]SMR74479.1 phosphoglycolate phosphatase [Marinobacterium sediminicola]
MNFPAAVLFDLDGTLLDTAQDFHRVVNRMLTEAGRPEIGYDSLRTQVSNGARAMVCHAFKLESDAEDFPRLHQQLLDYYAEQLIISSSLFPGMLELLDWLDHNGIHWGIVTNKPKRFTQPLLKTLDLDTRCGSIICPEDVSRAKPDPEGLLLACHQLGVAPEHSVYVGDHVRDIEAGRAANMCTIAAGWGYLNSGETPEEWCSDHISHRSTDLQPLLHSIMKAS